MNIIKNGGFDSVPEGSEWVISDTCELIRDAAIALSHSNCLQLRGSAYQHLSTRGVNYYADGDLTFWVKNQGGRTRAILTLVVYPDSVPESERLVLHSTDVFPRPEWHRIQVNLNQNYPLRQVGFLAVGSDDILIDDVSIEGTRVQLFFLFRILIRIGGKINNFFHEKRIS